jgi:metal-responsive CopG/Arc/MetJ family transcriptional regulator
MAFAVVNASAMRIAVSMPDELFLRAEELAARMATSRSNLVCEALRAYLERHSPDRVTEAMDAVVVATGQPLDRFSQTAAHNTMPRNEW